jgi:hypothetical protein
MPYLIDRTVASEHLRLAERHLAEGQRRVNTQLALVARLEQEGHNTQGATSLLFRLEETLALQVRTRDRIAEELISTALPRS